MHKFKPTHEITHMGRKILVMESDHGSLYTREEWETCTAADWTFDGFLVDDERTLTGLHFQGQVPPGESSFRKL